jgi:nucleosome assembly protein 1-like 1
MDDDVNFDDDQGVDDDSDEEGEDDDGENQLAHLPAYVLDRVEKLKELDESREKLMESYQTERAALEKKFEQLLQPLYKDRKAVILGERDAEIAAAASSKGDPHEDENGGERIQGVPQFWCAVMMQMEVVGELITEDDVDCLDHLVDIACEQLDDGKGFTLSFFFRENDYFTNPVLTKSYVIPNLLLSEHDPSIVKIEGSAIDWKEGKSLTHRTVQKKQRGKGKLAGQVRTVSKTEEKKSFFQWFTGPEQPNIETMDEEKVEQLEEWVEADFDVAQAFRSSIVPEAVRWFTGEVIVCCLDLVSILCVPIWLDSPFPPMPSSRRPTKMGWKTSCKQFWMKMAVRREE